MRIRLVTQVACSGDMLGFLAIIVRVSAHYTKARLWPVYSIIGSHFDTDINVYHAELLDRGNREHY